MDKQFTTGDLIGMLWQITIKKYPNLSVIDDTNYQEAILNCTTEEQQNFILQKFLNK